MATTGPAPHRGALVPVVPPAGAAPPTPRRGDVDQWGRSERVRSLVRAAYDPVYRHWHRAEWEGLDRIPSTGGALLVANHAGAVPTDAPLIMHGVETELGRPVYGLADFFFRSLPFGGTLWSRAGGVSAHPDNAHRLLADGQLALVFPEGTKGTGKLYRDRYHLRRFGRGGFVETAMRTGVPIVPIAVVGGEEAMPMLTKSPALARALGLPYAPLTLNMLLLGPLGAVVSLPSKFRFRVLPPVHFDEPPGRERYRRSSVMDAAEAIRADLQEQLFDMLAHRRSPWTG